MPAEEFGHEQSVDIAAPPARVWELISDPTRTPEWSPVCHRVEWVAPSSEPTVGARFRGHNQLRAFKWSRDCEIDAFEPERELAFHTEFKDHVSTRWRYRLEPTPTGTHLTETYRAEFLPTWIWLLRKLPRAAKQSDQDAAKNITTSLTRIKELAEASAR